MKIRNDIAQGSLEWLAARCGIPTASEFDNLVTPKFQVRKGQMPETYLASKLAEWWLQTPQSDFNSWSMDQGVILEEEARRWVALQTGQDVETVGLCLTDDGRAGCSPDGIIGKRGLELKCLQGTNQTMFLLSGKVPDEYLAQIHGGMFVTGFDSWLFASYHRGLPKLIVEVERDEEIQASIREALEQFSIRMDEGKNLLMTINGGPPRHLKPKPTTKHLASDHRGVSRDDILQ